MNKDSETFYPGASRSHLAAYPPKERWDDWTELDSQAWPRRKERHYSLVPTTCFNCESACGLLAYIDKVTGEVQKFEGIRGGEGVTAPKARRRSIKFTIPSAIRNHRRDSTTITRESIVTLLCQQHLTP